MGPVMGEEGGLSRRRHCELVCYSTRIVVRIFIGEWILRARPQGAGAGNGSVHGFGMMRRRPWIQYIGWVRKV